MTGPTQADIDLLVNDLWERIGASDARRVQDMLTALSAQLTASEAARVAAEARVGELVGTHCKELTAADRAYITAHHSYELHAVGKPPTWNQLAMEVVRLSNALAQIGAKP